MTADKPQKYILVEVNYCPRCMELRLEDCKKLWWGLSMRVKCKWCNHKFHRSNAKLMTWYENKLGNMPYPDERPYIDFEVVYSREDL